MKIPIPEKIFIFILPGFVLINKSKIPVKAKNNPNETWLATAKIAAA
jgi:hypothetical protein